ncbi:class I SAM-dependent methyltransferase [Xanthobacter oligotrophicus]|uniref:class I SAM-dependent methyltransferase n=1 Tax=Xanthobacter oligotrophicus TaxID=2607286 RepID=UPI0011F33137|nr:class I SAM-dependent methyltransferase [Xanthobacter oligotrophicus]MCG5236575.1 class I SAM-dependent methyltransferase [Xanthobacter oligotrophicus]
MQHPDAGPADEAPRARRPAGSALALIDDWLGPLAGRLILDVGCGRGALAKALTARGTHVVGIDPATDAIEAARVAVPEARFEAGGAEALPYPAASFDAVLLLNSFHHVPHHLMAAALAEAMRVGRGSMLIIEPLAEGPFFEAMRPVEDETAIRHAAQAAIAGFVTQGRATIARDYVFDDVRHFSGVDAFLDKIVAVDPARAAAAGRLRGEVAALMARWGTTEEGGVRLDQPHRAVLLEGVPVAP